MTFSPATTIAYKYLSKYFKTERQAREYLTKKWFEYDEINAAILKLIDLKVLDDRLYAEMYLHSEVARKWKPLIVAKQKLYHKWIDMDITQQLIDDNNDEYQSGMHSALLKLWSQRKKTDTIQKRIKRIIGRGYTYDLVKSVTETNSI